MTNAAIHPNTIRAILRKAGFTASSENKSGMVRGWSTFSFGYRVYTDVNGQVRVRHKVGSIRHNAAQASEYITKYAAALSAFHLTIENNEIVIQGRIAE